MSDSCSFVYKKKNQKWADENGFKFKKIKHQKPAGVHFYPKRKSHDYPYLHLDGNKIKVKEVKFLAIIFDSKLSFVPHIEMLKEKCTKALDGVKMVAHSK